MKKQYRHLTAPLANELLNSIDYVLLDVDGVLWQGDTVIPRIPETIRWLKEVKGKKVRYMTNNSTMSRREMVPKFRGNGIKDAQFEEIFNSGYCAGLKLKSYNSGNLYNKNVFVLGNQGLIDEIQNCLAPGNFCYGMELNLEPNTAPDSKLLNFYKYKPNTVAKAVYEKALLPAPRSWARVPGKEGPYKLDDLGIGAVVVGFDFQANVTKMALACALLADPKVHFVCTNPDPQIAIGARKVFMPGAGTMMSFCSTASGRKPDAICGKPETMLMDVLCEVEKINDRKRCLMVGDRLTTDIDFGTRSGTRTMMVLSGCEKESDIGAEETNGVVPDYVAQTLASLMTLQERGGGISSKL